jgi:hypothetical protein
MDVCSNANAHLGPLCRETSSDAQTHALFRVKECVDVEIYDRFAGSLLGLRMCK